MLKLEKESYQRNLIRKAIYFLEDVTNNGEISLLDGFDEAEIENYCVILNKFCTKFDLDKNIENLVLEAKNY